MTTIYIAIIEDRHTDTEAYPFSTAEAAIDFARTCAQRNARHRDDDVEEETIGGWLYYARYSTEGDKVWVVEQELDAPDGDS